MQAVPVQMPMPAQAQAQQQPVITPEMVATAGDADAQKQFLGNHLYARVEPLNAAHAGKIVGMMLDVFSTEQAIENLNN